MQRSIVWSLVVGFGCGGGTTSRPVPHAPPAPPAPPVERAEPKRPSVNDPQPAPPAAPKLVDTPLTRLEGAPACTLRDDSWHGALSFAQGGKRFAYAIGASGSFLLPQTGTGMFAELADEGIKLAAWVESPELHVARSVVLSKVVYPRPTALVSWEGLKRTGSVSISLDVSSALSDPAIARADIACKDLAIEETSFKLPASVPKGAEKELILERDAPLSTTAAGKPVATVKAAPTAKLLIAGKQGASTHIVLDDPDFVVHGWIATSMLEQGVGMLAGHGTSIGRSGAKITQPNSENHPCVRDLPLFVELAGTRTEIGALITGSPHPRVKTEADAAGYVEVEHYGRQWLQLVDGARLVVRDADLKRCHTP